MGGCVKLYGRVCIVENSHISNGENRQMASTMMANYNESERCF